MIAMVDEFGEVKNDIETYRTIAATLASNNRAIIGWTDGAGTHLDVLFALRPPQLGRLASGNYPAADFLFVGISSRGCFGFRIAPRERFPTYVLQKLGLEKGETATAFTEMLNGVMVALVAIGG